MTTVRLIESDIFSSIPAASAGSSAVIDLNGAPTISCQIIFEVSSPVGASVTFQSSNVGGTVDSDWTDLQAATAITVDGTYLYTEGSITYRFFRAVKALSSGSVNLQGRVLVTGDGGFAEETLFAPLTSGPITDLTNDVSASGPGSVPATVNSVGGSTASEIHSSVLLTAAATAANTASTIVKRDASGNFVAGTITAALTGSATKVGGITVTGTPTLGDVLTATSSSAADWQAPSAGGITALTGDVTASGTGSVAATVALVGGSTAASVHTSQLLTAAATAANTASTLVLRDGSGNFAAGTITASFVGSLTGTASGNLTALTGDITASGGGSQAATIAANAVTNAKAAQMAAHTFKGNNTGSTANALDLTVTQATAELNAMVGDSGSGGTKGLVPAPAAGDAAAGKFLKADGVWTVAGGGSVATPTVSGTITSYEPVAASSVSVITSSYAMTTTDGFRYIKINSSGSMNLTLPQASANAGRRVVVDWSTNNFTHLIKILPFSGDSIGIGTIADSNLPPGYLAMPFPGSVMTFESDGIQFRLISEKAGSFIQSREFAWAGGSGGTNTGFLAISISGGITIPITVSIPAAQSSSGTSNTRLASATALSGSAGVPSAINPTNEIRLSVPVFNSGANVAAMGMMKLATNGIVTFYLDGTTTTAFASSTTCGTQAATAFTYGPPSLGL